MAVRLLKKRVYQPRNIRLYAIERNQQEDGTFKSSAVFKATYAKRSAAIKKVAGQNTFDRYLMVIVNPDTKEVETKVSLRTKMMKKGLAAYMEYHAQRKEAAIAA